MSRAITEDVYHIRDRESGHWLGSARGEGRFVPERGRATWLTLASAQRIKQWSSFALEVIGYDEERGDSK